MLFTLKNLGRLEEATIDLSKDLIVLTGPNNSSKTYVAHAIYGFFAGVVNRLLPLMTEALAAGEPDEDRYAVDVQELTSAHLAKWLRRLGDSFTAIVPTIFAAEQSFADRTSLLLELELGGQGNIVRALLDADYHYTAFPRILVEKKKGAAVISFTRGPNGREQEHLRLRVEAAAHVAVLLNDAIFRGLTRPHIFTSDRSAIQLFSRELSMKRSDLVESLLQASSASSGAPPELVNLLRQGARRYPLAVHHELETADDLAKLSSLHSDTFEPFVDDLEADVLGGKISVTREGDYRFRPTGSTVDLKLHLSSSSVRSLASMSFYLRHLAQRNDFLIVDEPELNLHPHNQRLVARLLARLSRSGIKVMMSTHSDYIVRELNNLVMLHRDQEGKLREKHGYREDEILDPERVGGYAFDGVHGRPIPVGPAGMKIEAMDRDIKELNRSSSDIYYTLEDELEDAEGEGA
jgi:hypothetical protein